MQPILGRLQLPKLPAAAVVTVGGDSGSLPPVQAARGAVTHPCQWLASPWAVAGIRLPNHQQLHHRLDPCTAAQPLLVFVPPRESQPYFIPVDRCIMQLPSALHAVQSNWLRPA